MPFNQTQRDDLAVARAQYRRKRLADAMLETALVLSTRPEPRHRFDDLTRDDVAVRISYMDADVQMLRDVLTQARAEGGPVFEEARRRVEAYLDLKVRLTLDGFRDAPPTAFGRVLTTVAKENGEAVSAIVLLSQHPTHEQLEQARREVRESIAAETDALAVLRTDVVCAAPRRAAMR